jgi:hypothetical protein
MIFFEKMMLFTKCIMILVKRMAFLTKSTALLVKGMAFLTKLAELLVKQAPRSLSGRAFHHRRNAESERKGLIHYIYQFV